MSPRGTIPSLCLPALLIVAFAATAGGQGPAPAGPSVVVTQADESKFPEISVYFEVEQPDGTYLLDARRDEFRVAEDGQDRPILAFEAPISVEKRPTTVVLVVDRSGSMEKEGRIVGLKRAVATFLDGLPRGSRVAVIAFGNEVELIRPFTDDPQEVRTAVDALSPAGRTRYFDAVAAALELLAPEPGRRAILALTDGEDTLSHLATIDTLIPAARRLGLPIHTIGLGTGPEVASDALVRLATETRGQAYLARDADQLRAIYEEIAQRSGRGYRLAYRTDRRIPDGTLRPIQVYYRRTERAGESAVFIRGMVAPAPGWPGLFLLLIGGLALIAVLPGRIAARFGKG